MTVMKRCSDVDVLVTPFVDGEVDPAERTAVAEHLGNCPPCRQQVGAERTARQLVREHAASLTTAAPAGLRTRCQAACHVRTAWARAWRRGALALVATLVLVLGWTLVYSTVINPTAATVAQLAIDHLKCFALFDGPGGLDPAEVRAELREHHGWDVRIPARRELEELSLVGGRRCLYLEGVVAHLLYRSGVVPVSVFILPAGKSLPGNPLQIMGYSAVGVARGGRTWVILARRPPDEVMTIARRFDAAS
jgi:anti-sigma factor (TIGR02949 family)